MAREYGSFTDRDVFNEVMSDESICVPFLERVLGVEIERVEKHQREKEIKAYAGAKGVWLDVYVKASGKVIDVEMQARRFPGLGRRMRFYQSAIDYLELSEGMAYDQMLESYVIFLCNHDPYRLGLPRYDIEPVCLQAPEALIGADMHWVVLNSRAFEREASAPMRALLEYMQTGNVDGSDPLVRSIAAKVAEVNGRSGGMFWSVEDDRELWTRYAKAEGKAEGMAEGMAEGQIIGEARLSQLISALGNAGRMDDVMRAAADEAYRKKLFEEFAIA